MNTSIMAQEPRILRTDDDGIVYSIPAGQVEAFSYLVEDIVNADWGSGDWHNAKQELEESFGSCKKDVPEYTYSK